MAATTFDPPRAGSEQAHQEQHPPHQISSGNGGMLLSTDVVCILRPFVWFYNWFYGGLLRPEDSFPVQVRKMTICVLLIALLFFPLTFQMYMEQINNNYLVQLDCFFTSSRHFLASVPAYIYCRVTRTAPDAMFTAVIAWHIICDLVMALYAPGFDVYSTCVGLAMVSMGGAVRWQPLILCLCMAALTISNINSGPSPMLALPGATTDNFFNSAIGVPQLAFILTAMWVNLTHNQFVRVVARSQKAVDVSLLIAQMLRDYDTDGVTVSLNDYEADPNRDEKLVAAFRDINANLEKYRPHLPNYVLNGGGDSDDENEESSPHQRKKKAASNAGSGTGDGRVTPLPRSARSHRGDRRDDSASVHSGGPTTTTGGAAPGTGRSDRSVDKQTAAAAPLPLLLVEKATTGTVVVSAVEVTWHRPSSSSAKDLVASSPSSPLVALETDLCHRITQSVADAAGATQASLHSFVGDRSVATWNATRRVAKAESRACGFADRLRREIGSAVAVTGTVCSGTAAFMFAGSKQKTFVCSSADLWGRVDATLKQLRHLGLMVVDHPTWEHAAVDFACRGLSLLLMDGVGLDGGGGDSPSTTAVEAPSDAAAHKRTTTHRRFKHCVYELLNERPVSERDQEWMYVLEGQSSDPNEVATQALQLMAVGKLSDAEERLRGLEGNVSLANTTGFQELQRVFTRVTTMRTNPASLR